MRNSENEIKWLRELKLFLLSLLLSIVFLFLMVSTIAQAYRVEGKSMQPSLQDNERIIVSKIVYKIKKIERFDIVIFKYPLKPNKFFIKRVIGLPGEKISIKNGNVFINGLKLDEPYLKKDFKSHENLPLILIPKDHYFVLGDHRNWSNDSRAGWLVPQKNIVGKVIFRYWPFNRIGTVR
ncbi:signal peptidase I [Candidatus Aminicenantes bacterium AC-335-K20]|jgi:signal peptidase I|nr:signal peptidase I [SCandidatus Aminicenantes bacterium Aminicenantia_JdfR_composite]MCP2596729.1 signal peptidase I [Candidatus Aminicenantes bacterium AC-335-G13]MCP2618519.1 signal peptidase I [Candidatus Aminicenantes bacterium AC-335-A11]MCP2619277.1 signal peptidase I [Candidatus Aminicenantes bacterium AC-335-K20]MCP2620421.1 signal peptidase I [Candidatus Aminicenantes bacterium AC-334-E05]